MFLKYWILWKICYIYSIRCYYFTTITVFLISQNFQKCRFSSAIYTYYTNLIPFIKIKRNII